VYDDVGGPALYVGGYFNTAGGVPASKVAKWDGSSWSALGSGMTPGGGVEALAVHDDGSGPALYAGGGFSSAGGVAASNIAKWNGSSWSPVGNGRGGAVLALAVFDDGGGPELYAGGYFTILGGVTAQPIARWDGSSWSPLGMGVNDAVVALAAHDDGGGSSLYVAGIFTLAGGMAVNRIAKWDGASWLPLGSGLSGTAFDLEAHDDGSGAALYAGGSFDSAFDSGDTFLAKWGCDSVPPTVSCPPSVSVLERWGSSPGEFVSFTVTASDAGDPAPLVVCIPPSGSFFPRGTTIVTCTATDASGNQSTCEFPVTVALKVRRR
jgi:hypothetical protein